MLPSIPASAIVNVVPNVIGAGGTGLALSGIVLTSSTRVPIGTVASFPTAAAVAAFFGPLSTEAGLAAVYFSGFDNSNIKPAAMIFAQYPTAPVAPYLRGGQISNLSLAALQALSGSLTFTINGQTFSSTGSISLASVTSFSDAAAAIQSNFGHYDAVFTGSIAGGTLTVSAVSSGTIAIGQVISGGGILGGTTITSLGSGAGGVGTYGISDHASTISSTTISAGPTSVTYDSQVGAFVVKGGTPGAGGSVSFATGSLAAGLLLTAATGAVQSPGSGIATPAATMDAVAAQTQNFATFMTAFKPSVADMTAFSAWANGKGNRFVYVMWDNDITVTTNANTASAGYAIIAAGYTGTVPIYDPVNGPSVAAFIMGAIASIDFTQLNGRTSLAFRTQAGLVAGVTNQTIAAQLIANGYNFLGQYATASAQFLFFYPGTVTGAFLWLDSFVNQIWMNNAFQAALLALLAGVKAVPYNSAGYGLIEQALLDPVNAAVRFGAIRGGVALSALQAAEVNAAAGLTISDTLAQRGWYLQIADAAPSVRVARGSPPCTFWYMDGQSVQSINLPSVEVQ